MTVIAVAIVGLIVFIIIRNKKDKDEYIKSLNATEDQALLVDKEEDLDE